MAVGIKSRDQLDREWWDAWWKADYSWDGLARKKWAGWFIHADGTVRDEGGNAWPPTIATPSVSPASAGDPPPPPEAVEASIAPGALFPPHLDPPPCRTIGVAIPKRDRCAPMKRWRPQAS
jgi:hypothetical protein